MASQAPYKVPQRRVVVDAFPLTASGKIQKFKLRELDATHELLYVRNI